MTQPAPTLSLRNLDLLEDIADTLDDAFALVAVDPDRYRGDMLDDLQIRMLYKNPNRFAKQLHELRRMIRNEVITMRGLRAQARHDEGARHDPDPEMAALNAADEAYHERKENP